MRQTTIVRGISVDRQHIDIFIAAAGAILAFIFQKFGGSNDHVEFLSQIAVFTQQFEHVVAHKSPIWTDPVR